MPTYYSTLSGHQATYYLSPSGNAMVNVQSTSPLKFRRIYVGTARMQFMWVSSGKSLIGSLRQPCKIQPQRNSA
jgi:hypothetical protein